MLGIFSKTRTVSRNGLTFQVPFSNFSSFRYLVHPDGTGTGWSNVEAVDIDQPHGLDYRYSQHIAKGVRKRINKEHVSFGDNTAGGEHKPGGCAILDIVDQTIDISIDDDTYKGRNIIYDQTNNVFWCFTNTDGTASTPDGYLLRIHPDRAWDGGDVTWAGIHQFDSSVCFSDAEITGAWLYEGTTTFEDEIDVSDVYLRGDVTGSSLKIVSIFGTRTNQDTVAGALAINNVYLAQCDGFVTFSHTQGNQGDLDFYSDSGTPPTTSLGRLHGDWGDGDWAVCFPIIKGDYWKITYGGAGSVSDIRWLPFGSGGCVKQ